MIALLADANIQGHVNGLAKRMQAAPWIEIWTFLQMSCVGFSDIGLDTADPDSVIWRRCQERELYLVTNNRNDDGPDSLENTIRICNTPQSLPVFTIGDAERLLTDRDYSDRVIWALLEYLLEADKFRGTGRLFLP